MTKKKPAKPAKKARKVVPKPEIPKYLYLILFFMVGLSSFLYLFYPQYRADRQKFETYDEVIIKKEEVKEKAISRDFYEHTIPESFELLSDGNYYNELIDIQYYDPSDPYNDRYNPPSALLTIRDKSKVQGTCAEEIEEIRINMQGFGEFIKGEETGTVCDLIWKYPADAASSNDNIIVHYQILRNTNPSDTNVYQLLVNYYESQPEAYKANYEAFIAGFRLK